MSSDNVKRWELIKQAEKNAAFHKMALGMNPNTTRDVLYGGLGGAALGAGANIFANPVDEDDEDDEGRSFWGDVAKGTAGGMAAGGLYNQTLGAPAAPADTPIPTNISGESLPSQQTAGAPGPGPSENQPPIVQDPEMGQPVFGPDREIMVPHTDWGKGNMSMQPSGNTLPEGYDIVNGIVIGPDGVKIHPNDANSLMIPMGPAADFAAEPAAEPAPADPGSILDPDTGIITDNLPPGYTTPGGVQSTNTGPGGSAAPPAGGPGSKPNDAGIITDNLPPGVPGSTNTGQNASTASRVPAAPGGARDPEGRRADHADYMTGLPLDPGDPQEGPIEDQGPVGSPGDPLKPRPVTAPLGPNETVTPREDQGLEGDEDNPLPVDPAALPPGAQGSTNPGQTKPRMRPSQQTAGLGPNETVTPREDQGLEGDEDKPLPVVNPPKPGATEGIDPAALPPGYTTPGGVKSTNTGQVIGDQQMGKKDKEEKEDEKKGSWNNWTRESRSPESGVEFGHRMAKQAEWTDRYPQIPGAELEAMQNFPGNLDPSSGSFWSDVNQKTLFGAGARLAIPAGAAGIGALINALRGKSIGRGAGVGALTGAGLNLGADAGALVGGVPAQMASGLWPNAATMGGSVVGGVGGGVGGYHLGQSLFGPEDEPDVREDDEEKEAGSYTKKKKRKRNRRKVLIGPGGKASRRKQQEEDDEKMAAWRLRSAIQQGTARFLGREEKQAQAEPVAPPAPSALPPLQGGRGQDMSRGMARKLNKGKGVNLSRANKRTQRTAASPGSVPNAAGIMTDNLPPGYPGSTNPY